MYVHTFKVSNAISSIQTSIVTIHRNMKDVVLSTTTMELLRLFERIQLEESQVYLNFKWIYKNHLGKKEDINA